MDDLKLSELAALRASYREKKITPLEFIRRVNAEFPRELQIALLLPDVKS